MATGSYERKSFTGGAAPTTLAGPLSAGATSITVADGSSYPDGAAGPYVIVINRNTSSEEKVLITSRTANVLTVQTRGYDDGTDQAHTTGETVEHVLDASTVDQANRYVNLQTTKGSLVAHDGTNPNAVTVGSNGDILTADSTASNGVAWSNRLTTAESDIDTLQTDVTALQGTDIVITLTGDATGTATITNLTDASLAVTVVDDAHNHVIANVDGLQTALDGKQAAGSYVTTATTFGGDVSGTYDAIVVADNSHSHTIANVTDLTTTLANKSDTSHSHAGMLTTGTSFSGDVSGLYNNLQLGAGSVGNAEFRDSAAYSVIGRSSSTTGDVADITAGTDGHVLRRSGTSIGFGTLSSSSLASGAVTNSILGTDCVTSSKIADNAINSEHYVDGSIDEEHLSDYLAAEQSSALTNGWSGYIYYWKVGNMVFGQLQINSGASATSTTMFTMPSGYRAQRAHRFAMAGSPGEIYTTSSGVIQSSTGGNYMEGGFFYLVN